MIPLARRQLGLQNLSMVHIMREPRPARAVPTSPRNERKILSLCVGSTKAVEALSFTKLTDA